MRTMAPPQCGQSHAPGAPEAEASGAVEFCGEANLKKLPANRQ